MYILAYGNIKSVYLCPEVATTGVSQHARKDLQFHNERPFHHGPEIPLQTNDQVKPSRIEDPVAEPEQVNRTY